MSNWDARLAEQVKRKFENYRPQRILLDNAIDNKELTIAGDTLIVVNASSANALATVRLNNASNEPINLKLGKKISTIFTKFYVSCTAQANDWLDIIIGIDFDIDDMDTLIAAITGGLSGGSQAQPAIIVTNVSANTNIVATASSCSAAVIKAPTTNTDLVWVNIGAAAVVNNSYDMVPGSVLSLPMSNTNKINALFVVANEKLIVIRKSS
jgi:hypothetical protein